MAFVSHEWKDRDSQYPNRRTLTDVNTSEVETVDVERDEGVEYVEGIKFNAEVMNGLESRIAQAFTRVQQKLNQRLDTIYPIGSIYISKDNTSPATVLGGGTWQSITGGVLLPSNSALNITGQDQISESVSFDNSFSATVNGAYAELPRHAHTISNPTEMFSNPSGPYRVTYTGRSLFGDTTYTSGVAPASGNQQTHTHPFSNGNVHTQGSISFSNMMPSTIVYAWQRIA